MRGVVSPSRMAVAARRINRRASRGPVAVASSPLVVERKQTRQERRVRYADGSSTVAWWEKDKPPANVTHIETPDDLRGLLFRCSRSEMAATTPVLVVLFAGNCYSCRTLHPKLLRIAEKEYPEVQVALVRLDALGPHSGWAQRKFGVDECPRAAVFEGERMVSSEFFAVNLSAKGLERLRRALRNASHSRCALEPGQIGPAVHAQHKLIA